MNQEVSAPVGEWLRAHRKALDLTQEALAERAGCSAQTVRKIEAGRQRPSQQLAGLLVAALGVPPAEHAEVIRRLRAAPSPPVPAASVPTGHAGRSLPIPPTALIGREADLDRLRELLLTGGARLVTLVGPPGIGKTRLALAAAHRLAGAFPDGVCFVELAPLTDPELVPTTISAALGLATARAALPEHLGGYLRDKRLLLVLDNCEHLPAVAGLIDGLLAEAVGLQVLATSRAPLRIYGEQEYPVLALRVPGVGTALPLDELERYEAVRLFVARVRDIDPAFALTAAEGPAVGAICARLDGLPLALELAAARVRLLPPRALLARLGARLELLARGPVTLPARQQTLWDAIAWSYALLDAGEQQLFRRLAVFQGGGTLEAVAAVCGEGQDASSATLALVESLVSKSLVRRQGGAGEPRFGMLETIKEYAGTKLAESGEGEQIQLRHAAFYLQTADVDVPEMSGEAVLAWLAGLDDEQDNLRTALAWALEARSLEQKRGLARAWRAGSGLGWYWVCRHRSVEARRWLDALLAGEAALAALPDMSPETLKRGKAGLLLAAGEHRWNSPESRPLWEQSLGLYRELGARRGVAVALNSLGGLVLSLGDLAAAQTLNEEALALSRELGTKTGISNALNHLSLIANRQGDVATAHALARQALVAAREVDDWFARADSIYAIASGLSIERAFVAAEPVWEEFGRIVGEHGDMEGAARALCGLGLAAYGQGNYSTAHDRYLRGLSPQTAVLVPAYFIIQLAGVEMEIVLRALVQQDLAVQDRQPQTPAAARQETVAAIARAVRLLGAGAALLDDEMDLIEQAIFAFVAARARDILGEPAFAAALAQGRAMPEDQAYAYARASAEEPARAGPGRDGRFDGAPPPAYLIAPPA